jgi:hypothetical protein
VHWYRDSAEQKAVYIETYRAAAVAARNLSQGLVPLSWGVILDIDETVLDNSDYEKVSPGFSMHRCGTLGSSVGLPLAYLVPRSSLTQ